MKKFVITAHMKNGDAWETTRHTKEGLDSVIQDILRDDDVVSFNVDEKIVEHLKGEAA